MDNAPKSLSEEDIDEIAAIKDIQDMWGANDSNEMVEIFRENIYAAKFRYVSGSPGYIGDLYVLFGESLDEPVKLIRINGTLKITD